MTRDQLAEIMWNAGSGVRWNHLSEGAKEWYRVLAETAAKALGAMLETPALPPDPRYVAALSVLKAREISTTVAVGNEIIAAAIVAAIEEDKKRG